MTTKEAHALTTTAEGLEKLRILAAEADGQQLVYYRFWHRGHGGYEWWDKLRDEEDAKMTHEHFGLKDKPLETYQETTFLPRYPTDANALHAAEQRLGLHDRANVALRVKWVSALHDLMALQPDCPVNNVGSPVVPDIDKLLAPITIRCAAFVLAAEWKQFTKKD